MKILAITAAAVLATLATGCKNDSEQDYLDYLESLKQPQQPADGPTDAATGAITLNELDGNEKFIELYNNSAEVLDISGYSLRKDESKIIYEAPSGTTIAPHGFLLLKGNAPDYSEGFTSGLSADKAVCVELLDNAGETIDTFRNPPADAAGTWQDSGTYNSKTGKRSFARYPDGIGAWFLAESTPAMANASGSEPVDW